MFIKLVSLARPGVVGVCALLAASLVIDGRAEARSLRSRISGFFVDGRGTKVTVASGRKDGVQARSWIYVLKGRSGRKLRGGKVRFRCVTIRDHECDGYVALSVDDVRANSRVQIQGVRRARGRSGSGARGRRGGHGLRGRVSDYRVQRSGTLVTIDRGADAGVTKRSWVYVLSGRSGRRLERRGRAVRFRCTRITRSECQGLVSLSVDDVRANSRVDIRGLRRRRGGRR